jgi:hypothetical protein
VSTKTIVETLVGDRKDKQADLWDLLGLNRLAELRRVVASGDPCLLQAILQRRSVHCDEQSLDGPSGRQTYAGREVEAFVKNAGLGFAIPYFDNGQTHDFQPDFIVRFRNCPQFHLILETKGFAPRLDIKEGCSRALGGSRERRGTIRVLGIRPREIG